MTKTIQAFRALHYNVSKISSLADVVSPPYDVIDPDLQEELYARSPYNFCRIDLTKENPRYPVAQKTFQKWREQEILIQDSKPAIYWHCHDFTLPNGTKATRSGFWAARRLESFSEGGIKPHEKTLEAPKQDRLELTRALQTQLSPVFGLYTDPQNIIASEFAVLSQKTPFLDFVMENSDHHRVWKVIDADSHSFLNDFFKNQAVIIADGHHRYETALNFYFETLQKNPGLPENAACRYVMMYLSNSFDPGLVILPIHRSLQGLAVSSSDLLSRLAPVFDVEEVAFEETNKMMAELQKASLGQHAFYLLTKDPKKAYCLLYPQKKWLASDLCQKIAEPLRSLDVTVLHEAVLSALLGLSPEAQARGENITYWKSATSALQETWQGRSELTFLLNPTKITDVQEVALAGEKMPQKSTFFFPKVISGLLMHAVGQGDGVG